MPKMFSLSKMFLRFFFAHEDMKKTGSKVAKPAQVQPKSQFLFHKNLPPRDFSIMTLVPIISTFLQTLLYLGQCFYRNPQSAGDVGLCEHGRTLARAHAALCAQLLNGVRLHRLALRMFSWRCPVQFTVQ